MERVKLCTLLQENIRRQHDALQLIHAFNDLYGRRSRDSQSRKHYLQRGPSILKSTVIGLKPPRDLVSEKRDHKRIKVLKSRVCLFNERDPGSRDIMSRDITSRDYHNHQSVFKSLQSCLRLNKRHEFILRQRVQKKCDRVCTSCFKSRDILSQGRHLSWFVHLFLCAATKYNHVELVTLVLSDDYYDINSTLYTSDQWPLFIAIRSGNAKLVEAFLCAGSLPSLVREIPKNHIGHRRWFKYNMYDASSITEYCVSVSAVEYACLLNQTQIVQLMTAYHKDHCHEW